MSNFSGLTSALSALHAQRRAMEVAGNNIANANTEGYSRQRVNMQSAGTDTVAGVWSTTNNQNLGVKIEGVDRIRDAFLESRGRAEHTQDAFLTAQKGVYATIENVFAEPGDTALAAQLGDFWGAWGDAANQPKEAATKTALIQRGNIVADGLATAHNALSLQWNTQRSQLDAHAMDINTTASSVASLNESIFRAQNSGLQTNELEDKRDMEIMHLAELAGATSSVRKDGTVDVFLGGSSLVSGAISRKVESAGAARFDNQPADPADPQSAQLRWADGNRNAVTVGGKAGATMETLTVTIGHYATELDNVAAKLADLVNSEHVNGYGDDGGTGRPFFTGTTAKDIKVAILQPDQVALGSSSGTVDTSIALKLSGSAKIDGGPDSAYQNMIANLGVTAQGVDRRAAIQSAMTADIDSSRDSVAGVNLDEEMTNMLTYQRGYEAASRVLTSIDAMLDQLINRTGLVGR
jgi:flagellar hook-associated protein 1 FlgK